MDEIRDLTAEGMEGATGGWATAAYGIRALSHYYNQVQREV
jgi:hypothetical protein